MKKNLLATTGVVLSMLAAGALFTTTNSANNSVSAASNIQVKSNYGARSNATVNVKGVKGVADKKYSTKSSTTARTYKVTAGTNKGTSWKTAFFLPQKAITSTNNPSNKKQTYFAGSAAQGFAMDRSGNMYLAFSRRNSNGAKTGYLYGGYIMRLDTTALAKLKANPKLLITKPTALLSGKHMRFSNLDSAFCSGSLAYDPASKKVKFFVAFSKGGNSYLKSHPVQMATVNPTTLKRESTAKFYLYDALSKHYSAPNVLAFDNSGNFYTAAAASLLTTKGTAYIITQGKRSGSSYKVEQLGMSIKPVLSTQLQGISIDGDRFYINSNSAYMSFSLSNYLKNAMTPSKAGSAQSWMGVEANQLSGNRETENYAALNGTKYGVLTYPNEVIMSAAAKKPAAKKTASKTVQVVYHPGYGIAIWNTYKDGRKVVKRNGKMVTLKHGTKWKYFTKVSYKGTNWYNLGGAQWLQGTYLKEVK